MKIVSSWFMKALWIPAIPEVQLDPNPLRDLITASVILSVGQERHRTNVKGSPSVLLSILSAPLCLKAFKFAQIQGSQTRANSTCGFPSHKYQTCLQITDLLLISMHGQVHFKAASFLGHISQFFQCVLYYLHAIDASILMVIFPLNFVVML